MRRDRRMKSASRLGLLLTLGAGARAPGGGGQAAERQAGEVQSGPLSARLTQDTTRRGWVELLPGDTYQRDFQLAAYIFGSENLDPPYAVFVRYRVTVKAKERWQSLARGTRPQADEASGDLSANLELYLNFETAPLRIERVGAR